VAESSKAAGDKPSKKTVAKKNKARPPLKSRSASKKIAAPKTTPKTRKKTPKKKAPVPIVGIGASAGGLEPFERFFDAMPVESGIAFVVIQHLSPDFESMMDELLSRHSSMDIERVVDDLPLKPNTIYLNPPRSQMIVKDGRFKLTANEDPKKLNLPIDIFFESMAREYGRSAIAIVLSGTGSDGTKGVAAIREFEGAVLVQSPESSKFDGMPRSVIESGNFDAIATPAEMPELIKLVRAGKSIDQSYSGEMSDDPAKHIFHRLRDKYGTDFGYYKDATIRRRFERRATLCGLDLESYATRLETDADELDTLYADLLIDVTSFFRDLKAFNSHPKGSLKGLGDDQISRYFEKSVDYYQVNQRIRRLIVFSKHNLLRDPPFTRIDLVSCRNVLIYFKEEAQQKTLSFFHFSLKIGGYLFLGSSETLGRLTDEFEILDRQWKIFQKIRDVRLIEATSLLPRDSSKRTKPDQQVPFLTGRTGTLQRFQQAHGDALEVMLKKFAPPGFLLNRNGEVAHVFGNAGKFVKIDGGAFSNRIIDLVDPALRLGIAAGLERLTTSGKDNFERKVIIPAEGDKPSQSVIVGLSTLSEIGGGNGHYLLTLVSSLSKSVPFSEDAKFLDTSESSQILQNRIRDLERDLTSTEESLQSLVEELQTSNEELQATNEELMASNEELQSTNEELHSVNEELYTVSAEHQRKIDELTVLTDDMKLLMKATNIGIIFLDDKLNIRRFTPSATAAFNLLDQDIGRPFSHTTYRFADLNLSELIENVIETGEDTVHEIKVEGKDFIMGILPYETSIKASSGIVITLVDVTVIKEGERERIAQKEIHETVLKDLPEPIMRMNLLNGTIETCNPAFARQHGGTPDEMIGKKFSKVVSRKVAQQTMSEIKGAKANELIKSQLIIKEDNKLKSIFNRNMRIIGDDAGQPVAMQLVGSDITAEYRYTLALEKMINVEGMSEGNTKNALQAILEIGCEYLDLSSAKIARVEDDEFIFENLHGDILNVSQPGDAVPYEKTVAYHLPEGTYTVSIPNLARSHLRDEPCYEISNIECYIGTRTQMHGDMFGVLAFMGTEARDREFSDMEKTMVRLLAQAVGFIHDRGKRVATLEKRQAELENLNEGLNRFTYLASHDLQEPLRKIQQSGELLHDDFGDTLDEDGSYFLEIMTNSAARMRSLIDDLLLYSTSANVELDKENIALATLVNSALDELSPLIKEYKAETKIGSLPIIACDAKVMKQVLVNIFGNSLKYRKNDVPPIIEVRSRRKKYLTVISFIDNGIGMQVEDNINIFEPFVRLHAKSEYKGTGIGLAICKSVCDRHGWTIDFKSEIDKGTEILIEIPNREVS